MPVTARLSKQFYDRFGDDIANEFVNWFNDVDATYRADLVRLNDTNFVRFDAKLEQRLAEVSAQIRTELAQGFAAVDVNLEKRLGDFRGEMLKWIVGLWVMTMLGIAGVLMAVVQLR